MGREPCNPHGRGAMKLSWAGSHDAVQKNALPVKKRVVKHQISYQHLQSVLFIFHATFEI